MNFSTGGAGTPYQPIPAGRYLGRICTVAYCGIIYNKFQQKDEPQLQIAFEVNYKGEDGRNKLIYRKYKASMHSQAGLRKLIEIVESKTLSNAEALAFDVTSLAGRFVWIEVENTPRVQADGTTVIYDKVNSVFPSLEQFAADKPLVKWDVRKDDITALPQRIQRDVMQSVEWRTKHGNVTQPQYAFGQAVPSTQANFGNPQQHQVQPWTQPAAPQPAPGHTQWQQSAPVQPAQQWQQPAPAQQPPWGAPVNSNGFGF